MKASDTTTLEAKWDDWKSNLDDILRNVFMATRYSGTKLNVVNICESTLSCYYFYYTFYFFLTD